MAARRYRLPVVNSRLSWSVNSFDSETGGSSLTKFLRGVKTWLSLSYGVCVAQRSRHPGSLVLHGGQCKGSLGKEQGDSNEDESRFEKHILFSMRRIGQCQWWKIMRQKNPMFEEFYHTSRGVLTNSEQIHSSDQVFMDKMAKVRPHSLLSSCLLNLRRFMFQVCLDLKK